jgi:2-polyprenyl-3-methyl-5-hydroxy-6-metoxy-1,4-benzoquinol methylase
MSTSYDLSSAYQKIFFNFPWYNAHSQTEFRYIQALDLLKLYEPSSILDVGSGRGNFLSLLKNNYDSLVLNACDLNNFHKLDYVNHFILDIRYDYPRVNVDVVTCLDVLEHLPVEDIKLALENMRKTGSHFVFSVSNHSDIIDGVELHLTQLDKNGWLDLLKNHCDVKHAVEHGVTYFFTGNFKSQ